MATGWSEACAVFLLGVASLAGGAACGSAGADDGPTEPIACPELLAAPAPPVAGLSLPPPAGSFDYQIGVPYAVPPGVSVVSRDREAEIAAGVYNICYVNAFQTQPGSDWSGEREALLLQDGGEKVIDSEWDEYVFDLSSSEKRERLAAIVGDWIRDCAARGFAAVELDNLDTFTRFERWLRFEHTVAYASQLLAIAHERALAVAQKNTAEGSQCFRALGFDFVVSEQCWENEGDCEQYTAAHGERVFDVEYDREAFNAGCRAERAPAPILRDRELSAPGPNYERRQCP